ncbi:MAG: flagellar biosynthetic protein FliP, partial [Alphaproteobacteria bacterium]
MPALMLVLVLVLAPLPVLAQTLSLDIGGDGGGGTTGRILQLIAILTVLSLAPSILVMVTSFTRIV